MTSSSYNDAAARRYAAAEDCPDSFANMIAPRIMRVFSSLERPAPRTHRTLDIGAGTGQLLDVFRAGGFETVGVDLSAPMLERRSQRWSAQPGVAVCADAAHLPLLGPFDLVTATFNVLNHLPDHQRVQSTLDEVSRVIAPDGLFVFDINTRLGLERTETLTVIQDSADARTRWHRHWLTNDVLRLEASGSFRDGDDWHSYDEVIDKIVLSTSWLESSLEDAGLGDVTWVANDLVTPLVEPEQHSVAFALVRPG